MKQICCIVGACEPGKIELPDRDGVLIIAADGGLSYLEEQGIAPDLTVGDFDSLGRIPAGENIHLHPVEKDDTDTMLAVKMGIQRGCDVFLLYGCLGGRPDHAYANYQTLVYLASEGKRGYLVGDGWVCTAVKDGAVAFPAGLEGTVSVFCAGDIARGVIIEGLYYPLRDGELRGNFPLGVSNRFVGKAASVSLREGSLLLMWEEKAESLAKRI